MGNCLVTKLKGVVNNENLPLFNAKVFTLEKNISNQLFLPTMPSQYNGQCLFSEGVTVTDKNGNPVSNPANDFEQSGNYFQITTSSSGGTVKIDNFDKLTRFQFVWAFKAIDINEFNTCLSINYIGGNASNLTGEVRTFVEQQIAYGRNTGTINAHGQTLKVDNVTTTSEVTVIINSATSYTIGEDTWNLINGIWTKSE